jgi:extracellular elastinolytic metalloproteinase
MFKPLLIRASDPLQVPLVVVLAYTCLISLTALAQEQALPEVLNVGADNTPLRFLTAPSARDPLEICQDHLLGKRHSKGFEKQDLDEIVVSSRSKNKRTGVTHLYMKQRLNGIDIHGAAYVAAVDSAGRLVSEADKLKRGIHTRAKRSNRRLGPKQAVLRAAQALNLLQTPGTEPNIEIRHSAKNSMRVTRLIAKDISLDEIPAKLSYVETGDSGLRLSWGIVIRTLDGRDWWHVFVDAESGALVKRVNWIHHDSYNVFPVPSESPSVSVRSVVSGVADPEASPFGWHDTNGLLGAEFTDTRGNNVFAQEDADSNDEDGVRPDGGPALIFDPAFDPLLQPSDNQQAATLNLFYWSNILHDVLYQYGFDESSGNFQRNNYAKGGIGNDPVQADAQDGKVLNNAQFGSPPDGQEPRMEIYMWRDSGIQVISPANIAGAYSASTGLFGAAVVGLTGNVVLGLDAANPRGPSITDGCTMFTNAPAIAGNIVLVDRGDCLFVEQASNAQVAGAIAIIVASNDGDELLSMSGQDPSLVIPSLFVGQSDGIELKAELHNGVNVSLTVSETRDASLDNGIIAHEYAHGLTSRLTGGASNADCLYQTQPRALTEGWSDWLALMMTATPADRAISSRSIGAYAAGGAGIRNYPYTRDMGVNPLTLSQIETLNWPHGVGEVWAVTLWDLYWNFVDVYGFDQDLYHGTGGNNVLMQLVVDGLKLQPCNPSFLEARDSIISADLVSNQGANQCLIWEAFARRGMGESAVVDNSYTRLTTEAFNQPDTCALQCGNGFVEVGEQCDDGNGDPFDGCATNCRTETELVNLVGNANGGTITLKIDGVSLHLDTTAGQSPTEVPSIIADAVNADTALEAIADVAVNEDGKVVVTGNVEKFELSDPGLSDGHTVRQVPLSWQSRALLLLFVVMIGLYSLAIRARHQA